MPRSDRQSLRPFAAPRVDLNIIGTGWAEGFGVHVAASIAPQIKGSAIQAQRQVATVAIYDRAVFFANAALHLVFDDSHHGTPMRFSAAEIDHENRATAAL